MNLKHMIAISIVILSVMTGIALYNVHNPSVNTNPSNYEKVIESDSSQIKYKEQI